jgi:hypothetical protein
MFIDVCHIIVNLIIQTGLGLGEGEAGLGARQRVLA